MASRRSPGTGIARHRKELASKSAGFNYLPAVLRYCFREVEADGKKHMCNLGRYALLRGACCGGPLRPNVSELTLLSQAGGLRLEAQNNLKLKSQTLGYKPRQGFKIKSLHDRATQTFHLKAQDCTSRHRVPGPPDTQFRV